MSVIFQTVINTHKLYSLQKSLKYTSLYCKCLYTRSYSDSPKKFVSFDEVVAERRAEARRSLVVQVNSKSSFNELYAYCSRYSEIQGVHHYKNTGGENFMLIEFASEVNAEEVLRNCGAHQKDVDVMALQSPFLWFRAAPDKKEKLTLTANVTLLTTDGRLRVNEDVLIEDMMRCSSVSEQIQMLYDRTMLNDIGVRLRYMVARQLEMVFNSLYANITVRPFGSSVNGFGRIGCDLDLVLSNHITDSMSDPRKRLVYHEKRCGERAWQRQLEGVAEVLDGRVAGAARVTRILHARVPILKYAHEFADLDCDLCYNNMSGVHMSELLWLYGSLDPRVRPLVFSVRRWASARGLTCSHPGRWITNFPLTLLVLFFLQQQSKGGAVLPPLKLLVQSARKEDIRMAEDNLNCTFLGDLNTLPENGFTKNEADLETLLLQFFEFYSQFDFNDKAISINDGVPIRKPNNQPLYIVNPLEPALNVSKNVSYEECERLRMEVRSAAWQLEAVGERGKTDGWGLLALSEKLSVLSLKRLVRAGNSHRLVSLKDLFDEERIHVDPKVSELKAKLEKMNAKVSYSKSSEVRNGKNVTETEEREGKKMDQKIKFKNNQVRNEVYRIRRNKMA